nr:hypothetical protein [Tanacetum cinerariifolium]
MNDSTKVGPTLAGNTPDMSSCAKLVTGEKSNKSVNFRTLITLVGNGVDVVVLVECIRAINEWFANTAYGFFWENEWLTPLLLTISMDGLDAMLENRLWFIRNNLLFLKKWHPDVNLLKEDVGNVPVWVKLHGVPMTTFSEDGLGAIATKLGTPLMLDSYTFDMYMQSWGRLSYDREMIELRADVELKDTIMVAKPKIVREAFYTCNIHVENKKKNMEPAKEVSKSNPFDMLNSVENDVDLGTNGGTLNLVSKEANSSRSSFWNVSSSSLSTTSIVEKIYKIKILIIDGKVTFMDNEGKPLEKIDSSGDYDSEDEVASVDNEMTCFLAKKDGYGTSYANLFFDESRKSVNFCTLITPAGNVIDVAVLVGSIIAISEWFINMADVELKDTIEDECPKNTGSDVVKSLKKPSQDPTGVLVGLKVRFKPAKQVYKQGSKKNNINTNGNKKKDVEVTKEVSNSNPFDVLNLVENDVDLATNRGTSNLASKEANSNESSFWNVESSSISTTLIVEKINKLEKLIIDEKNTLVDDEIKPLKKVDYPGDHDSKDEVAPVDNEMESFLASERVGYGNNSLLEQWMDTYEDVDYDYDPYDDDMYQGQYTPDNMQSICDNLDIKLRGSKKK